MTRGKFFVVVITLFIIASNAISQISIQAANLYGPGHTYVHLAAEDVTVNTGSAGANQTWTIPAYTYTDTLTMDIVDPATTAFAQYFPTATRAAHQMQTDGELTFHVYEFERIAADGWYFQGVGMQLDTIVVPMPMVPEFRQAPLPVNYGDTWTSVRTFDNGGGETERDSSILTVDGWGTVNTPFGSHAVLRIFIISWETTFYPGGGSQTTEDANFIWVNAQGVAVAELESNEESHNPNFTNGNVSFTYETSTPVSEPARGPVAESFAVGQNYPNPFNPSTLLPVELSQTSRVKLDIYDETGRLVSSKEFELSAGSHTLPVDGSDWATGTYFARVSAGAAQQTTKMQLVK